MLPAVAARYTSRVGEAATKRMNVEAYLALEETSRDRHEFLDGQTWAMSGGTDAHDALSTAFAAELRGALSGGECSARGANLRVKSATTGLYTYADALVVRRPRFEDERRTTPLNPRVVVEVLSESSEAYDRGDKFAHYRSIESIGDYVLVATTAPLVEVYSRGEDAWTLRVYRADQALRLPSVDVAIAVASVYAGIELDPPRVRALPAR